LTNTIFQVKSGQTRGITPFEGATIAAHELESGYLMIKQIEIRNFKCFKNLSLKGLRRFNVVVGRSGSGKTALLEALFLAGGGNPEIYFRVRRWRGFGESGIELTGTRDSYEALFRDMFYRFDQKAMISVRISDTDLGNRSLDIYYKDKESYSIPLNKGEKSRPENAFLIHPIVFKWDIANRIHSTEIQLKGGQLVMEGSVEVFPIHFASTQTISSKHSALRFSNLSRQGKAEPVLEALSRMYPDVEDITLEIVAGEPLLHVKLVEMPEKLPLGDLSGGINKYISLLLAILENPGGAILIDEIENGFYYKNIPELLNSLISLCEEHEVQMFATTHSYEFLQLMSSVMENHEKSFSLLRLEQGSEQPEVRVIPGDSYAAAMTENFEVR
jgi:ABC-type lipoprotein export system ATPase subunit